MDMIREPDSTSAFLPTASVQEGAQAILHAQSAFFAAAAALMADWLHRRQEAVSDANRLLERLHGCHDVAGAWDAHHEWMQSVGLRLAADVCGPLAAAVQCLNGATPKDKAAGHPAGEAS